MKWRTGFFASVLRRTSQVPSAEAMIMSSVAATVLRHERKNLPPNTTSSASIGVAKKKKKQKTSR